MNKTENTLIKLVVRDGFFDLILPENLNLLIRLEIFNDQGQEVTEFQELSEENKATLTFVISNEQKGISLEENNHHLSIHEKKILKQADLEPYLIKELINYYLPKSGLLTKDIWIERSPNIPYSFFDYESLNSWFDNKTIFFQLKKVQEDKVEIQLVNNQNERKFIPASQVSFKEEILFNEKSSLCQLVEDNLSFASQLEKSKDSFTVFFLIFVFSLGFIFFLWNSVVRSLKNLFRLNNQNLAKDRIEMF